MNIAIIIPAAGHGARFGSDLPKQYHVLGGSPILAHTIRLALSVPSVGSVVVAVSAEDPWFEPMLSAEAITDDRVHRIEGDLERQYSIHRALAHPSLLAADLILVHDAVRPLASQALFERVIHGTIQHGACVPAVPVTDTVKRISDEGIVLETVPRTDLRRIQTPQGFRSALLREAYANADVAGLLGTDDASLVEAFGASVHVVSGDPWNIKVTTPEDLVVAECLRSV